jgi:hypothetical protein
VVALYNIFSRAEVDSATGATYAGERPGGARERPVYIVNTKKIKEKNKR